MAEAVAEPSSSKIPLRVLEQFFTDVAYVCAGADRAELQKLFEEDSDMLEKFLQDQTMALFLYQAAGKWQLSVDARLGAQEDGICMAYVKNSSSGKLDPNKHLRGQVTATILPSGSPFDSFLNMLQFAYEPRMSASVENKPKERREKAQVMQCIEELLATMSDQSAFRIPQVDLEKHLHEVVVQKCRAFSELSPSDIADRIAAEKQNADKSWDSEFLNQCNTQLTHCTRDIKSVTDMVNRRNSVLTSAREEIKFWNDLADALAHIQKQIGSKGWHVQVDILRRGNRIYIMNIPALEKEYELSDNINIVKEYQHLLQGLPIQKLHKAFSIQQMQEAVEVIYSHVDKHMNTTKYPMSRLMQLIDAVTRDFNKQLLKILVPQGLLNLDFDDFSKWTQGWEQLFLTWTTRYRMFITNAKQAARRQQGTGRLPERVQMEHLPLKQRVEQVSLFRRNHQKFVQVLKEVMPSGEGSGVDALDEMQKIYNQVKETIGDRLLDVTDDGRILWDRTMKAYEEKVEKVEQHITAKLRDRLSAAQTATEMFRVFSKFNPLTSSRPKIRSAIQQYQTNLIEKVKQDLNNLQDKFAQKYEKSEAAFLSRVHDLPQVSSTIIWAKAIERQLQTYMKRVEDVYGRGWDRLKGLKKKHENTGYWVLDEQLADLVGVKLSHLEKKARECLQSTWLRTEPLNTSVNVKEIELQIIGTGVALAFLEVVFPDSRNDWQSLADEGMHTLHLLEKQLQVEDSYSALRSMLQDLGVATQHVEGSHLRGEGEKFRHKINNNIMALIKKWNENMHQKIHEDWKIFQFTEKAIEDETAGTSHKTLVEVQGPIFKITSTGGHDEQLVVNFDPGIVQLIKEMQVMNWLNFMRNVDFQIAETAIAARDVYPHAMALMESTKMFQRDIQTVDRPRSLLLAKEIKDVYKQITLGLRLDWQSELELNKVSKYAKVLHEAALTFHRRLEEVNKKINEVEKAIEMLDKCDSKYEAFEAVLTDIQKKVLDKLDLGGYDNMLVWEQELDSRVERILAGRLTTLLRAWTQEFTRLGDQEAEVAQDDDEDGKKKKRKKFGFVMKPVEVKIRIHNRVMGLEPSLDHARAEWTKRLLKVMNRILSLPRLQATRYDKSLADQQQTDNTYSDVLDKVEPGVVYACYSSIDKRCEEAYKYFEDWVKFQALWEMELDRIVTLCGEDLVQWLSLLGDIKQSKNMMDFSEQSKDFGAIVVFYKDVQSKVSSKYDETQRKLLDKFCVLLGTQMKTFYQNVHEEREVLEKMDFTADSHNMIKFLTRLPAIRKKHPIWSREIELLEQGDKTLRKQRSQLPPDWMWIDQIRGEWDAFNAALDARNKEVASKKDVLQRYVVEQDKENEENFGKLKKEWNAKKPVKGDTKSGEALDVITIYEEQAEKLKTNFLEICKAKEALDMEVRDINKMDALEEDIHSLKDVWEKLAGVYKEIEVMGETPWKQVNARKVAGSLRELEAKLRNFPSNMRTYDAFTGLTNMIDGYLKVNPIIMDLCGEGIKDRHWSQIVQLVHAEGFDNINTLTLGKVWGCDLIKYHAAFQGVIRQAQGEMALEEFLAQVRKTWQEMELEVVEYQRCERCWLIKGWDSISEKLSEHINSLQSMRMSPYFKAFEEEGTTWEDKLCKIQALFGVPEGSWFEVQRRWVYLEGIFIGNQDIKRQLPNETQAFKGVDHDFKSLMQQVKKSPFVMSAFGIPGVAEKLGGLLRKLQGIQKALGDYLENQRRDFPRFYFVGDEDLLEIIGHSKEPQAVQKHFKKMFAGICTLAITLDENSDLPLAQQRPPLIHAMASFEGENVRFRKDVDLKERTSVNEWLKGIQDEMQEVLRVEANNACQGLTKITASIQEDAYTSWIDKYPTQVLELCNNIEWTRLIETQLRGLKGGSADLASVKSTCVALLSSLAQMVLKSTDNPIRRKKIEHLITSLVYQRDATGRLIDKKVGDIANFDWLVHLRFYIRQEGKHEVAMAELANAILPYSYEYLGVGDRLVQTPLTDKCYLTLTQALHTKMGGAPAGPAGTGKTETVKALGVTLARFVLVFCCDEAFDFKAMGRIFVGLCQVGAWGCFDEFNRLEERILSAVSQQIQIIQLGLAEEKKTIKLLDRDVPMHRNVGIFITMNPGYAGRSELPDNLKQLFRAVAMSAPDREIIAEVMLFSQGFQTAAHLAKKVVPLFQLCKDQLSPQGHYDFGLRALKSTLVNAGNMKREEKGVEKLSEEEETFIMLKSITKTIEPKLVADDIPLFRSLTEDVFPGVKLQEVGLEDLIKEIKTVCKERHLVCRSNSMWLHKVLQLYQIQRIHHGLMLVGPSCSGKTMAWSTLLIALARLEGKEGHVHFIDPKAISKSELYGNLDPTTRDWTDGIFTSTLRSIVDSPSVDENKIHWIIFDGDVDPEWVENLNSLLDDNKLLTLPNGERLQLPDHVRIMFEVQDLKYATLATVSRCGMVWFSEEVCTVPMTLHHYIGSLGSRPLEHLIRPEEPLRETSRYNKQHGGQKKKKKKKSDEEEEETGGGMFGGEDGEGAMETQKKFVKIIKPYFEPDGLVHKSLELARELLHDHTIMEWNTHQYLGGLFSLLNKGLQDILEYNSNHPAEFPLPIEIMEKFAPRRLILSIAWGLAGACNFTKRTEFCQELEGLLKENGMGAHIPPGPVLDFEVVLEDAEWSPWERNVVQVDIPANKVGTNDVIIATVDTVRHEEVVLSWLQAHRPMMFCGPPGSGKTMTLTSVLRRLTDYEPVFLNFSSGSNPDMILKTFEHPSFQLITEGSSKVLRPATPGKWIVVFCDECNLPATDNYGTQRVISLLRQLMERGGFYKPNQQGHLEWITLQRVQFAGACNPPTDPGRVPLSHRFLRWAPLLFVDFPSKPSLEAIYGTFCRAFLKPLEQFRQKGDALARAMVQFYQKSQNHFTAEMQAHYVYSPRELSRWTRAVHEGLESLSFPAKQAMDIDALVRLAVHEGLRLFRDRLVLEEEKEWTDDEIDQAFCDHFPEVNRDKALARPMLYSTFLTKEYSNNDVEELRRHVQGKLKTFADEEMDVQLVVFDSVLDHILRIDRIIRQPLGHMLLVGVAGAGKTVLSKFVAWKAGMSIFQIKAHRGYTIMDFEEDLRTVLKRAGCKGERICFIFDESNVMSSGFLEYMNALLASGEVPGLFEGQEHDQLMQQCREGINSQASAKAKVVDTSDKHAMYKWFVSQVQLNLHVIFTMNPNSPDFHNRCQTSPALFNRCTIDWFGEWNEAALEQVAREYTAHLDLLESQDKSKPVFTSSEDAQNALVSSIVRMHHHVNSVNDKLRRMGAGRGTFITPRHYLDFIQHFKVLYKEKRSQVIDQQMHLNTGLNKLAETTMQVNKLKEELNKEDKRLQKVKEEQHKAMEQLKNDQIIAGHEQEKAMNMEKALSEEQAKIDERTKVVRSALADAEPALEQAKSKVQSIPDAALREIKQYSNPPESVQRVMEMVVIMLGKKKIDWKSIKEVMQGESFLRDLVNFDSQKVTATARDTVANKYLSDPKFDAAKAYKASKAAGPLFEWCEAQLSYARILLDIKPLTSEITELEEKKKEKTKDLKATQEKIEVLNKNVEDMEKAFGKLTSEAEQIKLAMKNTKVKCERSEKLLESLSSERTRWEEEKKSFSKQITTVVGDCLLGAGFLAYNGYFDDHHRHNIILPKWMKFLKERKVSYKKHLSLQEYLSKPDQRLQWQENGLPPDELYVENAIILSRFQRYPLMIDPSGMAVSFLMTQYKDANIAKTSFLEDGFMKALETSLRFGYPLLVQDVECIDPIMNPILNKEVSKQGGRTLIRLGEQSIDLSPTFKIFLSTRDSTFQFAPDLCGRVTFANFTVTPGSLTSQCLHHTLKVERPDIEEKRSEMLKAQGEYKMKQRMLEQELLEEISKAKGDILENDQLIKKLEYLKQTTTEVKEKLEKTDETMDAIKKVEKQFRAVADASSKLYFMLQQLPDLNKLYQYSLAHFIDILDHVITDKDGLLPPNEKAGKTSDARRDMILRQLFAVVYERVSRSMLIKDHLTLGLRLCQVRLALKTDKHEEKPLTDDMWNFLTATGQPRPGRGVALPRTLPQGLEPRQKNLLSELLELTCMQNVKASIESDTAAWTKLLQSSDPMSSIPPAVAKPCADEKDTPVLKTFKELLVLKVFRPDALKEAAAVFIKQVFDGSTAHIKTPSPQRPFLDTGEPSMLAISEQADAYTPMVLCSAPGFDASDRVQGLAKERNKNLIEIAMGSPEGFADADKALFAGLGRGDWLLLKNVHLSPAYLSSLEKKLHAAQLEKKSNSGFRLFLTSEISPKLPTNLLVRSQVLVFEPSNGMKPSLVRTIEKHKARMATKEKVSQPRETPRLHFIAAWLHAIVMERLRYLPLGWAKKYEFSEGDFSRSVDTIDQWVAKVSEGRSNVPPNSLPWRALFVLLGESVYGGRIDNEFDQHLIRSFLSQFFSSRIYDPGFKLTPAHEGEKQLEAASGHEFEEFEKWVHNLPPTQTPVWLGLPKQSQKMIQQQQGEEMLVDLVKIQDIFEEGAEDEDDESASPPGSPGNWQKKGKRDTTTKKEGVYIPEWARRLLETVSGWLEELFEISVKKLNKALHPDTKDAAEGRPDPIVQALRRELTVAMKLHKQVKKDLDGVLKVCKGEEKPTNTIREIMSQLSKESIPSHWKKYTVHPSLTVSLWVSDFAARCRSLAEFGEVDPKNYQDHEVNLGMLFFPGAFITATRQAVARQLQYPLERLRLSIDVSNSPSGSATNKDGGSFKIAGLGLQSCTLEGGKLEVLRDRLRSSMKVHRLWWRRMEVHSIPSGYLEFPLYLNSARTEVLAKLDLPINESVPPHEWYQLGAAVTAWNEP